ncbi:MAG: hypothetical protein K2P06_06650, partial [Muribaculaceae bacterium]|nr:hypothetical protein [Muribaculaceae bacterium]
SAKPYTNRHCKQKEDIFSHIFRIIIVMVSKLHKNFECCRAGIKNKEPGAVELSIIASAAPGL